MGFNSAFKGLNLGICTVTVGFKGPYIMIYKNVDTVLCC